MPEPDFRRSAVLPLAVLCAAALVASVVDAQDREPKQRTYAVATGLQVNRFRGDDGVRMGASGPALGLDYSVGRRWAFGLRASFLFPLHGSQSWRGQSEGVNLRRRYDASRTSLDVTFLVLRRVHLNESLDLVAGGGIHVATLRLMSSTYEPIELITGGLGGLVRLERALNTRAFYGGELAASLDLVDFVRHDNRVVFHAPVALTAFVGVRR